MALSLLHRAYGCRVQETGHKTVGHTCVTDRDKVAAREVKVREFVAFYQEALLCLLEAFLKLLFFNSSTAVTVAAAVVYILFFSKNSRSLLGVRDIVVMCQYAVLDLQRTYILEEVILKRFGYFQYCYSVVLLLYFLYMFVFQNGSDYVHSRSQYNEECPQLQNFVFWLAARFA